MQYETFLSNIKLNMHLDKTKVTLSLVQNLIRDHYKLLQKVDHQQTRKQRPSLVLKGAVANVANLGTKLPMAIPVTPPVNREALCKTQVSAERSLFHRVNMVPKLLAIAIIVENGATSKLIAGRKSVTKAVNAHRIRLTAPVIVVVMIISLLHLNDLNAPLGPTVNLPMLPSKATMVVKWLLSVPPWNLSMTSKSSSTPHG